MLLSDGVSIFKTLSAGFYYLISKIFGFILRISFSSDIF